MQVGERFISERETYELTSVSPREQNRKPGFPRAIKIGVGPNGRKVRLLSEVVAWQEAQIAQRDAEQQEDDDRPSPPSPDIELRRSRGRPRKHPLPQPAAAPQRTDTVSSLANPNETTQAARNGLGCRNADAAGYRVWRRR